MIHNVTPAIGDRIWIVLPDGRRLKCIEVLEDAEGQPQATVSGEAEEFHE